MAKINGVYTSLSRGVSQQVPEHRLEGQHEAQINLLTDPVNGLARRHGARFIAEKVINRLGAVSVYGRLRDALRGLKVVDYNTEDNEYVVVYPSLGVPYEDPFVGSEDLILNAVSVFRKTPGPGVTDGAFIPVVLTTAQTRSFLAAGVSAVTQVGRLLLMATHSVVEQPAQTDDWAATANSRLATVWVRGGAYARTFKVTATLNGVVYEAQHTTPTASYPGTLNTTDIPYSDPNYTKLVNDRVNAYNSAVTAWIGSSGAAIQPPQIARALTEALNTAAGTPGLFFTNGAHIMIAYTGLDAISVDDGGDGTLLRAVHQTVKSADLVSDIHYSGKLVRVQAEAGTPAYYLKSTPVDGVSATGPMRWEEASRVSAPYMSSPVLLGTVHNDTMYIAESPAALRAALPGVLDDLPDFNPRLTGDQTTSPDPQFLNRKITYLSTFQDRLVVAAGSVVCMSETGNYFNFYRTSSLTVKDSDPVEVYALGAEDDTIRHSVIFDKSLLLFGDRRQYSIDGRVPVTSATTTVIQSSAVEDATDAPPVTVGDLVFFAKRREESSQLYQIEVGDVQDTSNSVDVGLQLSDYLAGRPMELLATSSPNLVLMRCYSAPTSVFVFRYMDVGRERVLDSWSRFDYGADFGEIFGMTLHDDQVLLFSHREARAGALGADGGYGWVAVDAQPLLSSTSAVPYLDSWRPLSKLTGGEASRSWWNQPWLSAAVTKNSPYWLYGSRNAPTALASLQVDFPDLRGTDVVAGLEYPSGMILTSPFRRDSKGAPLPGRLTVNHVSVAVKNSGKFRYSVLVDDFPTAEQEVTIRKVGVATNLVGRQPVVTGTVPVFVGRNARDYRLQLSSVDWQPLTFTTIEWTGQWFSNTPRA